jgi:superfamily II DNA or RNA helicase
MSLLPGTHVEARGLRWEVVFTQPTGEQTLFRLRCLSGALRGTELELLSPFEEVRPIAQELVPMKAAPLNHFALFHRAFLLEQTTGGDALLAAQPGRLRVAPYQLVPVMRALRMSRPRILLADGVGLGKTIEAGLVLVELIARRRAHRVLIVSPPGVLLDQWRQEMRDRFGLRFDVLDRERLDELRRTHELGCNPFDDVALGLISVDFAKQEKVLSELERSQYDLIVVDEAHHAFRLGSAGDREDSLRRRLVEVLARRSDGLLLLTATPHDGYDPHFASLIELLDPSLVDGRGQLRGDAFRRHVVRRLKRHVRGSSPGLDFPERRVEPRPVPLDITRNQVTAEFHRALLALVSPQLATALRRKAYGDALAWVSLLKRSVSTTFACGETLRVIHARLSQNGKAGPEAEEERKQRLRTLRDFRRRAERFGALSPDEEEDIAILEAEEMAADLDGARIDRLLEELDHLAEAARRGSKAKRAKNVREGLEALIELADRAAGSDPKLDRLLAELQAIRRDEPDANVLVFTEYAHSQQAAAAVLRKAVESGNLEGEVLTLDGNDPEATRTTVTGRFCQQDKLVLLSTDASAEGVNLHARCHHLIHLELPYNPNRLEQRNGRIDRFGQTGEPVVRYLYLERTFEERLLLRLIQKYEAQRETLSFVPNTLGVTLADESPATIRLLEGLEAEGQFLPAQLAPKIKERDDPSSKAYQDLMAELDRVIGGYEQASRIHQWLAATGLNAERALAAEADRARARGTSLGTGDLVGFVRGAVEADGGQTREADGLVYLTVPPSWCFGLEGLPGWDEAARLLVVTTDVERTTDAQGKPVGFLGRAHPIVRRALDRVRNLQFTSKDGALDRRVSAARHDGPEELLLTFVGRVESEAGRELERVLAVRVGPAGAPEILEEPSTWQQLLDPARAVRTSDVWASRFESWAPARRPAAEKAAAKAFSRIAAAFAEEHGELLQRDRTELDNWLQTRTTELCGRAIPPVQANLFDESAPTASTWQLSGDPIQRLGALATDADVPVARRAEAQTVLSLFDRRRNELERRSRLRPPQVMPLGMLMLVPAQEVRRGA